MIETKKWYAVTGFDGVRPHSWFYALRIAEDPWGIGTYRWDTQATEVDEPWRGDYEKVSDQLHRIVVKQPWGRSEEYELRPLDEYWIDHHAADFTEPPLRSPSCDKSRVIPLIQIISLLDYNNKKRIAWRETKFALREEKRHLLTDAMVDSFIHECKKYPLGKIARATIFAEPEGVIIHPPWNVKYSLMGSVDAECMKVLVSNRFTNDREFTIDRNGILNHAPASRQTHAKEEKTANTSADESEILLRHKIEAHCASGESMDIVYFGGAQLGKIRVITPLGYSEARGDSHLNAFCHTSGIEKTFLIDRMHLPELPLADGVNDYNVITNSLCNPAFIDGMMRQIATCPKNPIEQALATHYQEKGEFETFFHEYSYGGFILELKISSTSICLTLGYEANDCEIQHYEFTPESGHQRIFGR